MNILDDCKDNFELVVIIWNIYCIGRCFLLGILI